MSQQTERVVLGIDPGLRGGLALVRGNRLLQVMDMPVMEVLGKKRVNVHAIQQLFHALHGQYGPALRCTIEKSQAAPGQSGSAAFSYGRGYGELTASLIACQIPYTEVSPQTWRRNVGLMRGTDKKASIAKAIELFPSAVDRFTASKDGRAEAALIAMSGV